MWSFRTGKLVDFSHQFAIDLLERLDLHSGRLPEVVLLWGIDNSTYSFEVTIIGIFCYPKLCSLAITLRPLNALDHGLSTNSSGGHNREQ